MFAHSPTGTARSRMTVTSAMVVLLPYRPRPPEGPPRHQAQRVAHLDPTTAAQPIPSSPEMVDCSD